MKVKSLCAHRWHFARKIAGVMRTFIAGSLMAGLTLVPVRAQTVTANPAGERPVATFYGRSSIQLPPEIFSGLQGSTVEAWVLWDHFRTGQRFFSNPSLIRPPPMLPLDGWEANRRIRAAGSKVPIITLTARAMEGDEQKGREAGCDDHDTRPVELPRLPGKIERLLKA